MGTNTNVESSGLLHFLTFYFYTYLRSKKEIHNHNKKFEKTKEFTENHPRQSK